ncbi:hypothetical protein J6590_094567, partial [Homalodisca vitripennis]
NELGSSLFSGNDTATPQSPYKWPGLFYQAFGYFNRMNSVLVSYRATIQQHCNLHTNGQDCFTKLLAITTE